MRKRAVALAGFLFAVASTNYGSAAAKGPEAPSFRALDNPINRQFNVSPGQQLTLDLRTGASLTITGWANNAVSVTATLGGRNGADCQVDMEQDSVGINITLSYHGPRESYSTDITLEIQVPRQFNLDIKSAGGGIAIANLEGVINGRAGAACA